MPSIPMRHTLLHVCLVAMAACAWLSATGCAGDPGRPRQLRLATGSEGGTYYRIGSELARGVKRAGFRTPVTPMATRGTSENLELLKNGRAELALVTQDTVTTLPEAERAAYCAVGPLYRGGAQFILRSALVRSGTVADLRGVHFYPGAEGSGAEASTLGLMEALGIEPDYVPERARKLGYGDSARALAEGRFDGVVLSGGPPVGAVAWLMENHPRKFELLSFSPEQIEQVRSKITGLYPAEIAAGVYEGQTEPVTTVGKQTTLIARRGLDASMLKSLAGVIENSIDEPSRGLRHEDAHPMLQGLTPEFWNQPLELPRCGEAR